MIRNNLLKIIMNLLSTFLYSIMAGLICLKIKDANYYVLSIVIPLLILLIILALDAIIKMFLNLFLLIFGRNDNIETIEKVEEYKNSISNCRNIGLLLLLLFLIVITMTLDILLCIKYKKIILLFFSLGIWILLIYLVLKCILKRKRV